MKKIRILLPTLLLSNSLIYSAEYVIPPEYDNIANSVQKSHHQVLISNLATLTSSSTYKLGSQTLKFKCVNVPKINCRGGKSAKMKIKLKEVPVLKEPKFHKSIPIYEVSTKTEDGGANFRVCGGAMGVISWDDSILTQDATTKKITHAYTPLKYHLDYYVFTNIAGNVSSNGIDGGAQKGDNNSYMTVDTEQICE